MRYRRVRTQRHNPRRFPMIRTLIEVVAGFAMAAICLLILASAGGCAALADLTAADVAPAFDPDGIVLEQDRCSMTYGICEAGVCFTLTHEITRFELTLESGETIECVGVYVEPTWPDKSQNQWLSASKHSDPRCEAEMERLAEQD